MKPLMLFIKRHPLFTYIILTFAITWGVALMAFGLGGLPVAPEQRNTLGMALSMLAGPSIAGVLLTGLVAGRTGYSELLSRLFTWRVGVGWYAFALLTAPLLHLTIALLLSLRSPEFLPIIFTADDKTSLVLAGLAAGLAVGIFEELGWTGFAIPQLRLRHGILATGLIVGLVWSAWHFLMFWERDSFFGALPLALLLARLFSWLPAYRVLMVWVYDRTESLMIAMLMHMSLTASTLILAASATGPALVTTILAGAAAWWVVVAAVALANHGHFARPHIQAHAT